MKFEFQHDHHPEVVADGRAIRRLERLRIKEDLENSDRRKELFTNLSDEQYKKMIGYINSLTQGEKINYEYADGQLPMSDTPSLEDKEHLMAMTFATVREILSDKEATEESLRLGALTLAGAINYIHPYKNGNGRTGRVMHYLMEYGSERAELFEKELYALIAKMPLYEGDKAQVLNDTPPAELEQCLGDYAAKNEKDYSSLDARTQATRRVQIYLDMMKGKISIPVTKPIDIWSHLRTTNTRESTHYEIGEIDGRELYIQLYLSESTAPHRSEIQVSGDETFNIATRGLKPDLKNMVSLNIDLV